MPADPFTDLLISPHDPGLVVVSPAPISGGHIQIVSPEYAHPVRAELAMPLDTYLVLFCIKDLPNWQGYACEIVGVQEQYTFVGGHAEPASPPEAPRFTFRVAGYDAPLTLIAWRRRVYCQGTPLFLEALWNPAMGEAITLKGLEWGTPQKRVLQAYKGSKLLKAIEAVGRPIGSTVIPEALFRTKYPAVYRECAEAYATPPKRHEIAEALCISVDTLDRYLADYGLSFPPF